MSTTRTDTRPDGGADAGVLDAGPEALETFRPGVDGAWDRGAAAHLARRSGFGMPPATVDRILEQGPAAAESLVADARRDGGGTQLFDTARSLNSIDAAQSWWLHRMLQGASPLREKVALFWHGHFATSDKKVENPRLMLDQIMLFRRRGLGPFADLVQRVAKDPAMLIWLDGNLNRAGKPNENFARELMELFTLGIGNYSEDDIKQAARAFTGWHVRGISFWFNRRAHDFGDKSLLKRARVKTGEEVVDICVRHPASSRFIARKLFTFFVHPQPSDRLTDALAALYERSDRDVGRYLGVLLRSRVFHGEDARRAIIASPVDFAIGTLRSLEAGAAPGKLAERLRDMGQELFRPPNVKGWDGHRAWINSTSLIARLRFTLDLVEEEPIGARVPWDRLGAGGSALDGIFARCFPGGVSADLRERVASACGTTDARRILASVMQLPEYQMI